MSAPKTTVISNQDLDLKTLRVATQYRLCEAELLRLITKDKQKLWLDVAEKKSTRALEREISMASPKTAIPEKMNYMSESKEKHEAVKICQKIPRIQLQMGVSEKFMLKLRRAQDLESQKCKGNRGLEETLEAILNVYLDKRDPVKKANRQKNRGKLQETSSETESKPKPETKPKAKKVFRLFDSIRKLF